MWAALGVSWFTGHAAERGFTLVAIGFACTVLIVGWRVHHSSRAAALLGAGALALFLARIIEASGLRGIGASVGILAGAVLVAGHVTSMRASRTLGRKACTLQGAYKS